MFKAAKPTVLLVIFDRLSNIHLSTDYDAERRHLKLAKRISNDTTGIRSWIFTTVYSQLDIRSWIFTVGSSQLDLLRRISSWINCIVIKLN
jgi:hypothetical protein